MFSFAKLFSSPAPAAKPAASVSAQTSEDRYMPTILAAMKEGIVVVDGKRSIVLFNKAAEGICGLNASEVIGKPIGNFMQFSSNDLDMSNKVFGDGSFSEDIKIKVTQKIGAIEAAVRLSSSLIGSGQGGWILVMHDISFEKELEEMKFGFISIAAHELRTPLTSIKGAISVLFSDYKDTLNQDQNNLLEQIGSNTDRLMILVENLLNVSRIERGAVSFSPTPTDWVKTASQIVDDFSQRAIEKSISLTFVPPTEPVTLVRADKVRIGEVISNLLSNALTYTDPHGKITVTIEKKGNEIWTSVSDTGRGIPKDAVAHLFTKFYRVNKGLSAEQNSHGTGLGLYIAKSIVDMHRGKIWVTSEVGKGSTFTFSLPLEVTI